MNTPIVFDLSVCCVYTMSRNTKLHITYFQKSTKHKPRFFFFGDNKYTPLATFPQTTSTQQKKKKQKKTKV